jgi:hypothetical protein
VRIFLSLLAVLAIAGCARVQSNVQSFSNLPVKYLGKRIAVVGFPKEIGDSLEWKSYKPVFERQFQAKGFVISGTESADYVALVTYGIGQPKTTTQVGSIPQYGQTGGGTTYHSGSVSTFGGGYGSYSGTSYTMPTYGIVGSSTYSYNVTRYTRTVAINIFDKTTDKKIYESKATSTGKCGVIGEVIDEIAEAMFQKFPSGTGKVTVEGNFDC